MTNCQAGETPDVVHWDGASWTVTALAASVTENYLYAVWTDAPDDVWAVGGGGTIVHFDGATWSSVVAGNGALPTLFSLWGSGRNDVWAAGVSGTVLHWDGAAWTTQAAAGYDLNDVWGLGPGDIWLASSHGVILHGDGSHWTTSNSGAATDSSSDCGAAAPRVSGPSAPAEPRCATRRRDHVRSHRSGEMTSRDWPPSRGGSATVLRGRIRRHPPWP